MADNTNVNQSSPKPSDVPKPTPDPVLKPLGALIGVWSVEASHAQFPGTIVRGQATFEWLSGGHFLIQRETLDHPDFPDSISIIGVDDPGTTLAQHYFDSRGVLRVYGMSLSNGLWERWRDAPGFWQRMAATFSDDGKTIKEEIELSSDGVAWKHDMEKVYTKLS